MFLKSSLHFVRKYGTKGKQKNGRQVNMVSEITRIIARAPATLLEDTIGVAAIVVVLLVGLSLPGMA